MTSKSSPKLKPTVWDGLVVIAVALLAVVISITVYGGKREVQDLTVVVTVAGQEVTRTPLSSFPDADTPYCSNGYTLYVAPVYDDTPVGICVTRSDCPSQDCVHTGTITQAGQSIVCLPAEIVVHLEGTPQGDLPDIVVG